MNQSETEAGKCSRRQKAQENVCAEERLRNAAKERSDWWSESTSHAKKPEPFTKGTKKFNSCDLVVIGFAY